MNLNLCLDATPSFLGFFDISIAPTLLFYAYIPILILSILFGFLIFLKNKDSIISKYFLGITLSFAVWIFLILFQWVGAYLETVHLAWQLLILPEISIFLFSALFTYAFIFKKDIARLYKYIIGSIYIVLVVILPTQINISAFDLINCEGVVGTAWPLVYVFEVSTIVLVIVIAIERLMKSKGKTGRLQTTLLSTGMVFFLSIFWLSNYFGELTKAYEINLTGPIGMLIFLGLLTYLIVRFHAFNLKLIAAQALVWGLVLLVGSQFFFIENTLNYFLNGFTFIASIVLGYFLIRSVREEVRQKEKLLELNINLKNLIKQRESLVHLVTHKVKSSFTRTKVIFASILDGTFGQISPKIKKIAQQGLEFDNSGLQTVDLVLNVANMQSGTIKYNMRTIDFKELVQQTISGKKMGIESKDLQMETEVKDGTYNTLGDTFWLKESVSNLIENAIKYTQKGTITIGLERKEAKILFYVKDTGMGITEEDKKDLFTEGGRGKDALKINIDSTGYGLYSVKLIIKAHKGKVWAESEEGMGSTFYIELEAVD